MKTSSALTAIILLLLFFSSPLRAQENRSPYAFEASFLFNHGRYDFTDLNANIDERVDHYRNEAGLNVTDIQKYQAEWDPDLRLGFRFWNIYTGFDYNPVHEQIGGYNISNPPFQPNEYRLKVSTREVLFYLGYMHPINSWFDLGAFYSIGHGEVSGSFTDGQNNFNNLRLKGGYTPWRVEARGRINLTVNLCIDLGVGWRSSKVDDMKADYGLELGSNQYSPVLHYNGTPVKADWSGVFFGGGLTLMQPFGQ